VVFKDLFFIWKRKKLTVAGNEYNETTSIHSDSRLLSPIVGNPVLA